MKNLIIAILVATTLVFGAMALKEKQKTKESASTILTLRDNLSETESRLEEQQKQTAKLQNNLLEKQTEAVVKSSEVSHLQQELTNQVQETSKAAGSNSPSPMVEMFKSKDMRNLIRTQQKAVMGPLVEKNYGAFFSSLGLNNEQTAGLKDLIVKKAMIDAELGVSMLAGDVDADKRKDIMKQARSDKEALDDQIKDFLGEENYPQFKDYEKSQPERMAINMFKDQQASGAGALTPDQEGLLVKAMYEERQNFKFSTDFYDQSKMDIGDLGSVFTEDRIKQFEDERAQLDKKYMARAQSILTADQIGPFETFLSAQQQMQTAGMKVAMQMFGAKK